MNCPTLAELPPAPPGRTGWPWTVETPKLPPARGDGSPWPRISIVTPSYKQGQFIEETIRSVLLQGYPDIEYIIIDGGSIDETVRIIRKYGRWLTHWVSEPDRGQSHAINKGLVNATGVYFNWLNSDDRLLPGALKRVAAAACTGQPHLLIGRCRLVDTGGRLVVHNPVFPHRCLADFGRCNPPIDQPACFVLLDAVRIVGTVREDLHYVMDWDWYFRIARRYWPNLEIVYLQHDLAVAIAHADTKSARGWGHFVREQEKVLKEVAKELPFRDYVSVRRTLRKARVQESIGLALDEADFEFALHMLRIAARNPDLIFFRPFLGAIKKRVLSATIAD